MSTDGENGFGTPLLTKQVPSNQIIQLRDGLARKELPGTTDLLRAVKSEIEYAMAMWRGDYPTAFEACRTVLAQLNDPALRGYRALWGYLAGSAAWLGFKSGLEGFDQHARTQYANAQKAAPAVSWLVGLSRIEQTENSTPSRDEALALQVENLEKNLEALGTAHDRRFDEEERYISENITENENTKFEPAHQRLGTFLGFVTGKVESSGAPDPWWILHDGVCLVFEDHSDGKSTGSVHVIKARQAASHPNWIRVNVPLSKGANIIPVLVTPVILVDKDALPHLRNVCVWPLGEFRAWTKSALQVVRDLRRIFPGSGDLAWRATAADRLQAAQLDPASITGILLSRDAGRVLKVK